MPNRAYKAKSGSNQATTTRDTGKKIQLSFALQSRTKASDTPTTRRSKLGGQNAEAERYIIGCGTVKIRARTPFGFNDSKHIGIYW